MREKKKKGRPLVENSLVLIISGAISRHPDHFALDMTVDTFPGGKSIDMCSEIQQWGLKTSIIHPNARSIENFFRLYCHIKHRNQVKLTRSGLYRKLKVPDDGGLVFPRPHAYPGPP